MKKPLKISILLIIILLSIFYIYTNVKLNKIEDFENLFLVTEESKKNTSDKELNTRDTGTSTSTNEEEVNSNSVYFKGEKYVCSDRFVNREHFENLILSSKNCQEATSLALKSECRAGSTMDLYSDSLATDICRKEFEANNPNSNLQKELNNDFDLCTKIDEGGGTLELSIQSMCSLDALYQAVLKSRKKYINTDMIINISDLDESLEITGSVVQNLNVGYHEDASVDEDFNFDGFNDLKILTSAGSGYSALYDYDIYLYNPKTKLFESFDKLKGVVNISVDKENKKIIQTFQYFSNKNKDELIIDEKEYKWQDVLDGKLENSRG